MGSLLLTGKIKVAESQFLSLTVTIHQSHDNVNENLAKHGRTFPALHTGEVQGMKRLLLGYAKSLGLGAGAGAGAGGDGTQTRAIRDGSDSPTPKPVITLNSDGIPLAPSLDDIKVATKDDLEELLSQYLKAHYGMCQSSCSGYCRSHVSRLCYGWKKSTCPI